MLAMVMVVAAQAQKERVQEQRGHRDKMMAEKLKLSDEQRQKAKTLNEDYRKKMDELRKKDDILVKDWRNQMMELNKKHKEDMKVLIQKNKENMRSILNEEQFKKMQEMRKSMPRKRRVLS